jgi:hypothetical protein
VSAPKSDAASAAASGWATAEREPPPNPVRIPNDRELPLQETTAGPFTWRHAYARASERRANNRVGQDYLTFQQSEGRFAFALCDGVGQSYFGELAARLLGDALLAWLWAVPPGAASADDLGTELAAWLADLTEEGTAAVAAHEHQPGLAPLVASVLERKRAAGSATTLAGGRIDLTGDGRMGVTLVALGDSRLRLWVDGAEIAVHPAEARVGHGWSTRRGIVGGQPSISLVNSRVQAVRVLAYSDGLVALDPVGEQIASADLQALIEASRADPPSDDIAVLDVWLRDVEPSGPGGESAEPVVVATSATSATAAAADAPADADADSETVVLPRTLAPSLPAPAASAPTPVPLHDPFVPVDDPFMDDHTPTPLSTPRPVPARPAPGGLPLRLVVLLVAGVAVLAVVVVLVAVWLAVVTAPSLAPAGPPG